MSVLQLYLFLTISKLSLVGFLLMLFSSIGFVYLIACQQVETDESALVTVRHWMILTGLTFTLGATLTLLIPTRTEMLTLLGVRAIQTNGQVTETTHKLLEYLDNELQVQIDAQNE